MAEADHLFMRPMPNMMAGEAPGAALFTYMNPDQYGPIVRKFIGQASDAALDGWSPPPNAGSDPLLHF